MANNKKTTRRSHDGKFAKGNTEGNKFTSTNQPTDEAKQIGRQREIAEKKELEKTVIVLTRLLLKKIKNKQGEELTTQEAMILALIKKALLGDIKAITLILSLLGEMPKDENNTDSGVSTKEAFLNYLKGNRPNAD